MAIAGYISLLILASTSMNNVFLLFVPGFFIFAANGILQVLTTVFLANTVDYGQLKTGRRDESVIFSMQTFVVKLASGISALIASLALQILALSQDVEETADKIDYSLGVEAAQKMGLRMTMTLIPIAGLIFAIFWFKKKYILTDYQHCQELWKFGGLVLATTTNKKIGCISPEGDWKDFTVQNFADFMLDSPTDNNAHETTAA